jgi:MFS family permease
MAEPSIPAHRWRTLWLTAALHGFTHMYQVALLPLYLRIQHDLHLESVSQATLLVTVMGVAYFLPSYPLGMLADRWSRKKLLATGLVINSLGFVSLSFTQSYSWALVSMIAAGFGGSFYHPSATSLIARLFPEAKGRALGLVGIGASFGFFLGPIYAGWRVVVTNNWRAPVLELGLLGFVAAGVFIWLAAADHDRVKPPTDGRGTSRAVPEHTPSAPRLFPTAALWVLFAGASVALSLRDFAGSAMATATSLFLQNAHNFDPKFTGIALSGVFVASAVSNPLFGQWSDGGRFRWGAFVLAMAAIIISIFPHLPVGWMIPALLSYGFFFMASYPITEAALMEAVPDSVRGRVFGLFITICGLIGNLSHWLVGDWIRRLGEKSLQPQSYFILYFVLALMVLIALLGLPCLRAVRRREHLDLPVRKDAGTLRPAASV